MDIFDEIISEFDKTQLTYLDRRGDCLLWENETGADLWQGMASAIGSCKGIVRIFQKREAANSTDIQHDKSCNGQP